MRIPIRSELSPAIEQKVVYSGVHAPSFQQAEKDLAELAEVQIGSKRIQRISHRVGTELVRQQAQAVTAYEKLPLVEKDVSPIPHPPSLAVVMADGGRYQRRTEPQADDDAYEECLQQESEKGTERKGHWREDKIGVLMTMSSPTHPSDPQPEIPAVFVDPAHVQKLAREIGHGGACPAEPTVEPTSAAHDYLPPKVLVRTYVATVQPIREFERQLRWAAWKRGFSQAQRKAYVADGASANWNLWRRGFPTFTPILDFIHALTYVHAAAMAGRSGQQGWEIYCRWIDAIWKGQVSTVIAQMAQRQAELGSLCDDEPEHPPLQQLAKSLTYLQNNQARMRYDEYRRLGLPLTSCHIESTIKRFNKRVKGTEKFWSGTGAEAVLHLKAKYLGETGEMHQFWQTRAHSALAV